MRKIILLGILFLIVLDSNSQDFTRKDSLRGSLTPLRTCYDVTFYDLFIVIDEKEKMIERSYNEIYFSAVNNFSSMQVDLAENMEILLIQFEGKKVEYTREFDAVFISFPREIKEGETSKLKIWYSGHPREAVNAPWDGGFSWDKDKNNKPWIGVSCQGLGASVWWPCKDHQSDEPDSMRITASARNPLKVISNGNLRNTTTVWNKYLKDSLNQSEWFVSYPINNYGVTLGIGDYVHFTDIYVNGSDTLDLSYYVLPYNEEKARSHFSQVKPMLTCFERYFGPYPFLRDGYALIETPFLGMEHQSAIAYGNGYLPGYYGNTRYISGLDFDFIIIHESGHEWWGNSITTNDIADMWIHEGFCTYSEVLYVECMHGYEDMLLYVNNQKNNIKNDKPIVGHYHVNQEGSSDMYSKASLMLHTLRSLLEDDELWFNIIREISDKYQYKTIDAKEIIDYIIERTGKDLTIFFSQYLNHRDLPEFQYKLVKEGRHTTLMYRWEAIYGFDMPILVSLGIDNFWIYPNNEWQEMSIGKIDSHDFTVLEDLFLIDTKKVR